jgi:hypothetical protein
VLQDLFVCFEQLECTTCNQAPLICGSLLLSIRQAVEARVPDIEPLVHNLLNSDEWLTADFNTKREVLRFQTVQFLPYITTTCPLLSGKMTTDEQWNIALHHLRSLIITMGISLYLKIDNPSPNEDDTIWHYILRRMAHHVAGCLIPIYPLYGHLRILNILFEHLHTTCDEDASWLGGEAGTPNIIDEALGRQLPDCVIEAFILAGYINIHEVDLPLKTPNQDTEWRQSLGVNDIIDVLDDDCMSHSFDAIYFTLLLPLLQTNVDIVLLWCLNS